MWYLQLWKSIWKQLCDNAVAEYSPLRGDNRFSPDLRAEEKDILGLLIDLITRYVYLSWDTSLPDFFVKVDATHKH